MRQNPHDSVLLARQGETKKVLRIILDDNGVRSEPSKVIDRMQVGPRKAHSLFLVAAPGGHSPNKGTLKTSVTAEIRHKEYYGIRILRYSTEMYATPDFPIRLALQAQRNSYPTRQQSLPPAAPANRALPS